MGLPVIPKGYHPNKVEEPASKFYHVPGELWSLLLFELLDDSHPLSSVQFCYIVNFKGRMKQSSAHAKTAPLLTIYEETEREKQTKLAELSAPYPHFTLYPVQTAIHGVHCSKMILLRKAMFGEV